MGDYDDDDGGLTVKDFTIDFHFENLGLVCRTTPAAPNCLPLLTPWRVVGMTGVEEGAPCCGDEGCHWRRAAWPCYRRHGTKWRWQSTHTYLFRIHWDLGLASHVAPSCLPASQSTFLTTLASKATYGNQTGVIRINGNEVPLSQYSKLVGFVPQEDVMMRNMTVEENLRYCAETRLPASWSSDRKMLFVDEVMSLLGLREIRHSQIGDERKRGISGGQRKRVNIGMEMCADPTVVR